MGRPTWIWMATAAVLLSWTAATAPGISGEESLLKAEAAFAADAAARGTEGWLDHFATDAVVFPPGEPVVEGKAAIRAFYSRTGFSPQGLNWKPRRAFVSSSGDLGYTFGTWEAKAAAPGGRSSLHTGKYLTVWRRQADGSWKVAADIGNADPAESKGG